jgi:Zn-dependent M28 family amino/carboxypeptidase
MPLARLFLWSLLVLVTIPLGLESAMMRMPGDSYSGPLPPLTAEQRRLAQAVRGHIATLAGRIGERNVPRYAGLQEAEAFITATFRESGYDVRRQAYDVAGRLCANLEAERPGRSAHDSVIVIGAHYDSVPGSPGANDNASVVAALQQPARTIRFVAFVNEEPPYFQTDRMGSWRYAGRSRQRGDRIAWMMSLETLGYYSDAPQSQQYPFPLNLLYPSTGNFVAFVTNRDHARLLADLVGSFRRHARVPSEGAAVPAVLPGVGWSDHWSFWEQGYPAVMVTDTALYRDPHYHSADDRPEHIDYARLALVVDGLARVIAEQAGLEADESGGS